MKGAHMLTQKKIESLKEFEITVQEVEEQIVLTTPIDLEKMNKESADLSMAFEYPVLNQYGQPDVFIDGDDATSFAEILVNGHIWFTELSFDELDKNLTDLLKSFTINKVLTDLGYKIRVHLRDGKIRSALITQVNNEARVITDGFPRLKFDYQTLELVSPTGGVIEFEYFKTEEFYDVLMKQTLLHNPTIFDDL